LRFRHRNALRIGRKTLGEDPPTVALSLLRQNISTRALGVDHPEAARAMFELGVLLEAKGDLIDAEEMLRQALDIRKQTLPQHHIDVAASLSSLALLLSETGQTGEARSLGRESYEIVLKTLGPNHPITCDYQVWATY
jgi:hypothetical protein